MFKGGTLYLYATIDVEDKPMRPRRASWGVDLRVANPAVTTDGETLPHPIRPRGPKGKLNHPDRQGSGAPVNFVCCKDLKLPRNSNSSKS